MSTYMFVVKVFMRLTCRVCVMQIIYLIISLYIMQVALMMHTSGTIANYQKHLNQE